MTNPAPPSTRGEAVIRRALGHSLQAIGLLMLAGTGLWFVAHRSPPPAPIQEAKVEAPAPALQKAVRDKPTAVKFTDITEAAGIRFTHINGAYGERLLPETMGSGAAFFDYDNDGDPDLFLANSRYWEGHEAGPQPTQALYRNDGKGNFTDATAEAGLALTDYAMGVAVGDYDGDGWQDLYLTSLHRNRLFHNEQGRFRDVTDESGTGGNDAWSSSAAFLDYDRDGKLDLFVANYVNWSREIDLAIDFRLTGLGRAYGAPLNFTGTHSYLFHNEGEGRFRDLSSQAGIRVQDPVSGQPVGKGLGVAPVDYDRDGWIDLAVANDTVRKFLFRNRGDGSFDEVGAFEGFAYDRNGKATSAMGIDAACYRNDAELGVAVGNFANEMSALFVTTDGRPPFADEAVLEGIGPATRLVLTFAVLFFDYDLDGRLDLFQANGHLESEIDKVQPSQHYAQPAQLFWNCGSACPASLVEVADPGDLTQPMVGRGAAYADIDGDGDLDLVITQNGRPARLFRNDQQSGHHWLRVKLQGKGGNRDAIGARVLLTAGGVTQERMVMPTRGYLSQVELPITFGLGEAARVDGIKVIWPDGSSQEQAVPQAVDRMVVLEQR